MGLSRLQLRAVDRSTRPDLGGLHPRHGRVATRRRFFKAYVDAWKDGLHQDNRLCPPKKEGEEAEPEEPKPYRRALPEPWSSPPFPGHEYQGYPLMGIPRDENVYPLMKAINGIETCGIGDWFKDNHLKIYGWATASGNFLGDGLDCKALLT
jgi:hypothetical protein